ncbi:dialkylresorcinol condensing enzyme DarA [Tamlana sp. 2_MG-2023]|uniref:dialkylrecorsinol condensing enzyme DarA n=1 Tax=unclassified Tamlana TaxID=2614803 RepID=UPI0026E2BA48|nr:MULTISPECIES: dialkylrecorsinol condensing enzyme DarA [unclassified Tamlana]MDO6758584.1 dialkylresorcinol condensing enzyme DarA [Tamlana sp. 2_MG-2023]MDO6789283.1 dialkylresorcinol condensing enzyme DarA [Tamlana sp. 1_MG-2023]
MKNILVIHYSQSGQLTEILQNIVAPLKQDTSIQIDFHDIKMVEDFPFPWTKEKFMGVFPESFLQEPAKIYPPSNHILDKTYDLIIFGYQVWYLTPSIPANSFLKSPEANKLFANTPVITVSGSRNMWIMAQEKIKKELKSLQANLVGNIALVDRHINHVSVITIVQWMFSGKKERFLKIFPKPGVSQKDIDEATKFGDVILSHLKLNDYSTLQEDLLRKDAVKIKPFLVVTDKRGNAIFDKWAKFLKSKGEINDDKRKFWVKFFTKYLLIAIWVIAPIVFILFLLTYLPFYGRIKREKMYYESVALK